MSFLLSFPRSEYIARVRVSERKVSGKNRIPRWKELFPSHVRRFLLGDDGK